MRTSVTLLLILLAAGGAFARQEETLVQLNARAQSAKPDDRVMIYLEIAHRRLEEAERLYTAGQVEQARAAVEDVAAYSEKARDTAIESGKKLKHTEIEVRKMAAKLRDMMRGLNFEDQPPVQAAIQRLEDVRTALLERMFGKK